MIYFCDLNSSILTFAYI